MYGLGNHSSPFFFYLGYNNSIKNEKFPSFQLENVYFYLCLFILQYFITNNFS